MPLTNCRLPLCQHGSKPILLPTPTLNEPCVWWVMLHALQGQRELGSYSIYIDRWIDAWVDIFEGEREKYWPYWGLNPCGQIWIFFRIYFSCPCARQLAKIIAMMGWALRKQDYEIELYVERDIIAKAWNNFHHNNFFLNTFSPLVPTCILVPIKSAPFSLKFSGP